MKKTFFGLFAVVIAIASVAFTTQPRTERTFRFDGDDNSEINIKNEWVEVGSVSGCQSSEQTACYVIVDDVLSLQDFKDTYVPSLTEPSDLQSIPEYVDHDTRDDR